MPPWMCGCSVLTRPSSISGKPVTSDTSRTVRPASVKRLARAAGGNQFDVEGREAARQSSKPVLSLTLSKARRMVRRVMGLVLLEKASRTAGVGEIPSGPSWIDRSSLYRLSTAFPG